jgi:signal transduction histidine kinase
VAHGIQRSIDSAREIATNLHPHHLDQLGFCAAIRALARTSAHSSNVSIAADCDDVDGALPKDAQLHLYRIIQESVQNVLKHARASQLDIAMIEENNELDITIEDNGVGFDVNALTENSLGMKNIRSRTEYLGGQVEINSLRGSGTAMVFHIPLK